MEPIIVTNTNLSGAWLETLKYLLDNRGKEISPFVLSLSDFEESLEIRQLLDEKLQKNKLDKVLTVAETIFPQSLYQYNHWDRLKLYEEYLNYYKRLRKVDSRNKNGIYFQRLIAYEKDSSPVNQLEIIIESLKATNVKRRSKLQASIFDPTKGHKGGMFQGFPCLQHITFYKLETGGLALNSFYALQYFYQRAYGNWLGLINLGNFIAQESGLKLEQMNCFVGVEVLDKINKTDAKKLYNEASEILLKNAM